MTRTARPTHLLAAFILLLSPFALAQAPAAAAAKPANATGQCKDGSYSTAASKSGACRGHNGVKDWYAAAATPASPAAKTAPAAAATAAKPATAPAPVAAKPATPAPAPAAAPAQQAPAKPSAASTSKGPRGNLANTPVAPGGGPGLVWVNTSSNVYHCPGTDFYGKTKAGSYMSEAAAKTKGARPDHGNACSK